MSIKKVAFLTTYKTDTPDQPEPVKSSYERKKPTKVPSAALTSMSTLTCRDFTKNSYDYRDKNFLLSDQGLTFQLPPHLQSIYKRSNSFQKTEFRKLPLKPGKLRNENKRIFKVMHESSGETFMCLNRFENSKV